MQNTDVVRACFDSYLIQDRAAAEALIADDFVFTSPQDDHIDRDTFFHRCFPSAGRLLDQRLLQVVPGDGDDVIAVYEYQLRTGECHRNVEVLTVREGRIVETQVYFGGRFPGEWTATSAGAGAAVRSPAPVRRS